MFPLLSALPRLPLFCLAALLRVALSPATPAEQAADDNFDAIREAFLTKINATRKASALPSLRVSPILSRLAQRRAEEIAAGNAEPGEQTIEKVERAAAQAGYPSRFLTEASLQADGDLDTVYAGASRPEGVLRESIERGELLDLGVGIAERNEVPLYVFLFGLSWEDFVAERRAALSDLPRVRRRLLERVNRERTSRGLAPVRENPVLDEAAQRHADDMLARSYYGHQSPEGSTVLERSKASGYRPRFVAENIAQGPPSVDEAMEGWIGSEVHREHILSPFFVELGSGVAVGKNANGYQILWVQCFGRPKDKFQSQTPRRTGASGVSLER